MITRSDDPLKDFERWDKYIWEEEQNLPHCDICGEPIYEEYYHFNGEDICMACMKGFMVIPG